MIKTYKFSISPASPCSAASAGICTISGSSDRHQPFFEPCLKPVHIIHCRGWLVINISSELEKALGRSRLQMTQSAPVLLYAHFETEQAIYQLHVDTRVQLALRD
jgi:hypothetical protein